MIKTRKQMYLVIGAFALVLLLGTTTYAFFNYTRTGARNAIKTGRIYFNSEQDGSLQLTNVFPVKSSSVNPNTLDSVTVAIEGDTTYTDGEEFQITLTGVNNKYNNKEIPINYIASYDANGTGVIGESSDTYWESRESKDANIYTLKETGKVKEGAQVLVGYIKNGSTGINGTLTIKAYIDADRIAISDTYPGSGYQVNTNMTEGELNYCKTTLSSALEFFPISQNDIDNLCQGNTAIISLGSGEEERIPDVEMNLQQMIDRGMIKTEDLELLAQNNVLIFNGNGTTSEWVNGRTVLTTEEWNSFQNSETPISFKIKAESNEGIWVEEAVTPDEYFSVRLVSHAIYNTNRTSEDIANCVTYFTNQGLNEALQEGETLEAFCAGTGTIDGYTMQEGLDINELDSFVHDLELINIVVLNEPEAVIIGYNLEGGSDVIIPNKISVKTYQYNTSRTSEDIANCVTYFTNQGWDEYLQEGETIESFCAGTGTIDGYTMQQYLDGNNFDLTIISDLESMNILTLISQRKYPVTEIGVEAFSGKQLTSVSIPSSVKWIGRFAFNDNLLTQLVVPDVYFENNSSYICKSDTIVQQTNSLEHEYRVLRIASGSIFVQGHGIIDEGTQIINKSGNKYCTAS